MSFEEVLKLIILVGATCGAVAAICALIIKAYKLANLIVTMHKNDERRTEESRLFIRTQLALCNGLEQLGANGPVTKAKNNLQQYIVEHYGGD